MRTKRHKVQYTFDSGGERGRDKVVVLEDSGILSFVFPSGNSWRSHADEVRAALRGGTAGSPGFRMSRAGGDLRIEVDPPSGPCGVVRIAASKMRAVIGR